uniref:Uncharacterized protein n=1 Tax=Arundo donax TaxID=35708 RepID=A0A0A9E5C1_ARUDO
MDKVPPPSGQVASSYFAPHWWLLREFRAAGAGEAKAQGIHTDPVGVADSSLHPSLQLEPMASTAECLADARLRIQWWWVCWFCKVHHCIEHPAVLPYVACADAVGASLLVLRVFLFELGQHLHYCCTLAHC